MSRPVVLPIAALVLDIEVLEVLSALALALPASPAIDPPNPVKASPSPMEANLGKPAKEREEPEFAPPVVVLPFSVAMPLAGSDCPFDPAMTV